MHSGAEVAEVRALFGRGLSDYEIARRTGVPRATVQRWRIASPPRTAPTPDPAWRPPDAEAYSYIFGLYLGDGCIYVSSPRSAALTISLDSAYPGVVEEATHNIGQVFPGCAVGRYPRANRRAVVLQVCTCNVVYAFPQHGAGRKHTRRIALAPWQRRLTSTHPQAFIRGLIHSDGCRTTNSFHTRLPNGPLAAYQYTRYFFSNLSADIRQIFCEHCRMLGIRCTQSNTRNISVAHRESVAILDSFVGPKR